MKADIIRLNSRQTLIVGMIWAFIFEILTSFSRFVLGFHSSTHTAFLSPFTQGFRIHHGYIGLMLILSYPLFKNNRRANLLIAIGVMLLVSDLIHHFGVLWPLTGSPEFFIKYSR